MTIFLQVVALVVAVVSVPTLAGLTAWGLAGGDGVPRNPAYAVLAVAVAGGSLYNALTAVSAFGELSGVRWWLMWVAPLAGLVGVLLALADPDEPRERGDVLVGVAMQVGLAAPAVLLLAAGLSPL